MPIFQRGISNPDFIKALQEEYNNPESWWRRIVDDKDLFIAIRNEYINVYFKGNSLIKLSFTNGDLIAETHYKYLIKPKVTPCLIKTSTSNGMNFSPDNAQEYFTNNISDIEAIKTASGAYSGIEKEGIQKIIKSNDNIVDLEIALTHEAEADEMNPQESTKNSAKRIDFAALQKKDDCYELIFFEAKDFSNPELRVDGPDSKPKVMKQIETYQDLLIKYEADIISSYNKICQNLFDILPHSRLGQAIIDIANGKSLEVNIEPRLVLFGFDGDQQKGDHWKPHKKKLKKYLNNKFLAKGKPIDFKNGIAKPKN